VCFDLRAVKAIAGLVPQRALNRGIGAPHKKHTMAIEKAQR
jgi:hypothetical protein